jgi:hypothetical protein
MLLLQAVVTEDFYPETGYTFIFMQEERGVGQS